MEKVDPQNLIRVLLVEDSSHDITYLEKILTEAKISDLNELTFKLTLAHRLKDALKILDQNPIDIALVNLMLPDSQGMETLTRIIAKQPHLPVVVLTDNENEKLSLEAVSHGAQDYLDKSKVAEKMLIRVIRHAIQRKQVDEELYLRNRALASSSCGIIITDPTKPDNPVIYANPAFERMTGYSIQEVLGKNCRFLEGPDVDQLGLQKLRSAIDEQKSCRVTLRNYRKDGSLFWNELHVAPVHDELGNLTNYIGIQNDITEYKRLERLKDEFISTFSHELRTPLTIIKGAVSNLQDGILGPLTDKQMKIIETASRNIDRLARIINDLLDLSRLESGKARMNQRMVEPAFLLHETLTNYQIVAKGKNLEIVGDFPQRLPLIKVDSDMLFQVFNNLINNALRYAKKRIILKSKAVPGGVEFIVADDGKGIPPDQIELLFNKFVQLNRPIGGAGYKGTGLGLAICKEIIDLHEGRIWAESHFGDGSQFHFFIPTPLSHEPSGQKNHE